MAESEEHTELVNLIVAHIRATHADSDGLSILIDASPFPPEKRPRRFGGYCPDVEARTVPASFVIIGEAKSYGDVLRPRTIQQLTAFLEYLSMQREGEAALIFAVPFAACETARAVVRRIQRDTGTEHVATKLLYH